MDGVRPTEHRQSGSLKISPARDLTAVASVPGAYDPSGALAEDTVCYWGSGRLLQTRGRTPPSRQPPDLVADQIYDEPVVWSGVAFSHYGHFAIESVGRLWPVVRGAELEGLPIVIPALPWGKVFDEWLTAFGATVIQPPKGSATRFKRMYVPEPAWRVDAWVAPEIRDIHLDVRRNLEVKPLPPRGVLWLSRSRLKRERRAYDECLLEWILADHVSVFHPEQHSLAEQIAAVEASDVVVGVIGSAFHSLLTAQIPPRCIYLCPGTQTNRGSLYEPQGAYLAQDRLLNDDGVFLYACAPTGVENYCYPADACLTFPAAHRILIPETLRALREIALPDLFDDPRAFALADPDRVARAGSPSDLVSATAAMLRDPLSADARMELGRKFEAEGLDRCALEQFMTAADLGDDAALALLYATRILERIEAANDTYAAVEHALTMNSVSTDSAHPLVDHESR